MGYHTQKASQSGSGAPTSVTPDFIGQVYVDTNTNQNYIAYGTSSGEWLETTAVTTPGQISEVQEQPASTIQVLSNDTWTQIFPESGSQSLEALQAGTFRLDFLTHPYAVYSTANVSYDFKIVIDEGESEEQTIGADSEHWMHRVTAGIDGGAYQQLQFVDVVELTQGTHTFKAYCRGLGGASQGHLNFYNTTGAQKLVLQAITGSGVGGILVDKASVGATTITGTLVPDSKQLISDLTLTFNTVANEQVLINYSGLARMEGASGSVQATVFIFIDDTQKAASRADIDVQYHNRNLSFTYLTDELSAGEHTAKFYFSKYDSGDASWNARETKTQVVRFRGGFVPIQEDGTAVLDKPAAINFKGATVTDNNNVADIQIANEETVFLKIGEAIDGVTQAPAVEETITSTNGKVKVRKFDSSTDEDVIFNWEVPGDCKVADGIKFSVCGIVTEATAPASGEGVAFQLSGYSVGVGDALNGTYGTAITSKDADLNTSGADTQYDRFKTTLSSAVTITDLAQGELAILHLNRDVSDADDDYAQDVGVYGLLIQYTKELSVP